MTGALFPMTNIAGAPWLGKRLPTRREAAVAFADIVGFTILTETAPEAAHAAWMRLLSDTLRPLATRHGCRFLKSTGDGVAAEFPTAQQAFAWACAVQQQVHEADRPDRPPIAFRIGIALGEVVAGGADIHGAIVNVAARLQEHAPPGGVALTAAAAAALPGAHGLAEMGPIRLRHVTAPVYGFVLAPAAPPRLPHRMVAMDRPSIAVMPFDGRGAPPEDRYFAEGVIEDIVLSLGALHDLSVTARSATLGWGAGRGDPCVVGRVLGVRYVLSGAARRGGGGLRLSVALHETEAGDQIWHERFDVAEAELFAVQDEIVARAVAGIAPGIQAAELRRALRKPPQSLNAYDHTLRGIHALDGLERDRFGAAAQHLDAAMRDDPGYAAPAAWAAQWHSLAVGQAWSVDPARDAEEVRDLAARAIQLDPRCALGYAISGHYRAYHQRDPQSALPFLDRAVEVGPSHALAWALRSASLSYLGRGAEALPAAEHGFRLSPLGADRYYFQFFVGLAQHVAGNHAAAARSMRLSLGESPGFTSAHRILIAALTALGQHEAAREAAADMLLREPAFRVGHYAGHRQPFADPALATQLLGALRNAGLPA
jgi:adenylate cyclase